MKKIFTNDSSSFNGQKMGGLANEHESNMNRTSIEHRSNMNGRRMGDEWAMNGRRMGEMRFAKFAKFAEFAKVYFARVAAVLLMLVTMSVGEVWGNYIVKGLPSDLDLGMSNTITLPENTEYNIYILDTGKGDAKYKWSSAITESVSNRDFWTGGEGGEVSFTTGAAGNYTFSASYVADNHIRVSVTYPVAPIEEYTIYFKNTQSWTNVYVHFYTSNPNFLTGNGCWGTGAVNKGAMTSIDGTYYSLTYTGPAYTRVCFTKEQQDNYGNFYENQCSYSGSLDLSSTNILWIPNSTPITSCNNCSYYNSGTWTTYPEAPAEYTGLSVSQTAGGAGAPVISANHVVQGGSVTVTGGAPASGYRWDSWTSENGTFGDASAISTTFTPTANNAEAVAHYVATGGATVYGVVMSNDGYVIHNMAETAGTWSFTYNALAANTYNFAISSNVSAFDDNKLDNSTVTLGASTVTVTKNGTKDFQFTSGATGDVTIQYTPSTSTLVVTAPAAQEKVYFVNVEDWAIVNAYAWKGDAKNHDWPGEAATKESYKICEHDVYSFSAAHDTYSKIIFNSGDGQQTTNLDWTADYYKYGKEGSYGNRTSAEANCAPTVSATTGEYCIANVGGQLKIDVTCANVKSGDKYRIYSTEPAPGGAYYGPDDNAASKGTTTWTAAGGIGTGTYHFYAILYTAGGTELDRSEEMVVEMENNYAVYAQANNGSYGSVTSGPLYCSEHVQSAEITATPEDGYVFTTWQLPAGVTLAGGYALTDATIRVKATAAGTVTAVFAEDLSCDGWFFKTAVDGWTRHDFVKDPAHKDESKGYYTLTVSTPDTYDAGVEKSTYYKKGATYQRSNNDEWWSMDGNGDNWKFNADIAGDYIFAIDYSELTPKVKVTYPALPDPTVAFGPWTSGGGTVAAEVNSSAISSGDAVTRGETVTLTATPDAGYYLRGWYNNVDGAHEHLIEYATSATNYVYTVENIQSNKSIYAKFEAIPSGLKLDGQVNGRSWNNCLEATNSDATSFSWVFDNLPAQAAKEFCFKDNECHSTAKVKPNMGYVTYEGDVYCTMGNSGASNYNFTLTTGDKYDVTITVTYGSGIHVTATAATPTPEITAIAIDPVRPREGNTVTVSPTLHYCTGSEYICWSVVDQSIAFTDNHNSTYSFTAPAEGTYTLKAQLRDAGDCGGNLLSEYSQTLRVYGDNIIIYAGMAAGWHDWQGIKACVGNGDAGTDDAVALEGIDLGEAGDGRHWFQFTLPTSDTHANLVLYNSYDEWPSATIGSARTATLTKPIADKCYLVLPDKVDNGYDNREVREDVCPADPSVTVTSGNHVVQGGTYTVTATTTMIPGTISYSYTVTDPSDNAVSVNAAGKFVASSVGTYHVTVRATGDGGISAISDVKEVVCEAASVTASVDPTSGVSVGGKVTLSAATTGFDSPTYQWFVQYPGTGAWLAISGFTEKSGNYTVSKEGTYTFKVQVTENGRMVESGTCTSVVTGLTYYIEYRLENSGEWRWFAMSVNNADGTYYYNGYWNHESSGVNINTTNGADGKMWFNSDAIQFVGLTKDESMSVRYVYDGSSVKAINSSLTYYRVRSVCGDKTYYSNEVVLTDEGVDVSFYAKQSGAIFLEKLVGGTWVPVNSIGAAGSGQLDQAAITADGVYTAKLSTTTTTNGNLTSVATYTGYYYIFSEVSYKNECRSENRMTQFNNINDEEYYNHYWCTWIAGTTKNTSATVGNEINHNLANALSRDDINNMSVRYAYNPETNYFGRAYLRGSSVGDGYGDCFLKVFGTNVKDENANALINTTNGLVFQDGSNWVYTALVYGTAPASIKLAACLDKTGAGTWDYLLSANGSADVSRNIYNTVNGESIGELRFYISYDFKTNRVIAAWYPQGTEEYTQPVTVDADLIVIRNAMNTGDIHMFNLSGEGSVKMIRKIYTALQLERDEIFNGDGSYKDGLNRRLFQISLPYDLNILDITGFIEYGNKMNIQDYMGELRALLGWQSYIETFWYNKAYLPSSELKAQRGYVLQHSLNRSDFKEVNLSGGGTLSRITIYFPSRVKDDGYIIGPISRYPDSEFAAITSHVSGREVIDSNWRSIGLPGFFDASVASANPEEAQGGTNDQETNEVTPFNTLHWVYDWNGAYMSYTAYKATHFQFKPTKSYMIQYAGTVKWGNPVSSSDGQTPYYPIVDPSPVAARQTAMAAKSEGEYCLRLGSETGDFLDQTYVVLDRRAADDYEMNIDLQKSMTNGAPQVYSSVGDQLYAANTVCDTTQRMALGTNLPNENLYTLSMSSMTTGSRVPYLYDAWLDTYTNLATDRYIFSGTTGKQLGRFYLLFDYHAPAVPTDWESLNGETFTATWVDGKIVLTGLTDRDVELYDAAGRMIYRSQLYSGNAIPAPPATGVYLVRNGANTAKIVIR